MEISSWGKHLLSVLGPLPRREDASIMLSVIIRQLSDARIRWRCRSLSPGRCLQLYGSSCTTMSHTGTIRQILSRSSPLSIYTAYCKVTRFVVLATRLQTDSRSMRLRTPVWTISSQRKLLYYHITAITGSGASSRTYEKSWCHRQCRDSMWSWFIEEI